MDKLLELQELKENLDLASKKDVALLISQVISAVKEVRKMLSEEAKENKVEMQSSISSSLQDCMDVCKSCETDLKQLKKDLMGEISSSTKDVANEAYKRLNGAILGIEQQINAIEQYDDSVIEAKWSKVVSDLQSKIDAIKPFILIPFDVRDSLESIEKEEDKLDVSAIKGIKDLIKKLLSSVKTNTVYVGGGSEGGGRIVKAYDLSSQLNGSLKTFSLPAVWRVISVSASSTPFSFRDTVDYTWTPTSITFTSEISEASTLAQGQTVIVTYSE